MNPNAVIQEYLSALIDYAPDANKDMQRRIFEDMKIADGLLTGGRVLSEADIAAFNKRLEEWSKCE